MLANLICGVDEAGRGPLAGPVYAAAVILGPLPASSTPQIKFANIYFINFKIILLRR